MSAKKVQRRSVSAAAMGIVLAAATPAQSARGPNVQLRIEEQHLVGDGKTATPLVVQSDPPPALRQATDITISASAGRLSNVRAAGNAIEAAYVPPFVLTDTKVTLRTSGRFKGRRYHRALTVLVKAFEEARQELESNGPLDLRIDRSYLVLGRDSSATVSMRYVPGIESEFVTNVGSISKPEPDGAGRLRATFTPPTSPAPSVALIAASGGDGTVDWIPLPLWGSAVIEAKADPGALVMAKIGGVTVGPFVAGQRGRTRLSIVAPPGVRGGHTLVGDGSEQRAVPFELGPPPFSRLAAFCPKAGDRIVAFAVDPVGRPKTEASLQVSASTGSLQTPTPVGPGIYESRYLPNNERGGARAGKRRGGTDTVSLTVKREDDRSAAARCTITPTGTERVDRAEMKIIPDTYVAGSGGSVAALVQLRDASNQPAGRAELVRLRAPWGSVSEARAVAPGVFAVQWFLPENFEGRHEVHISGAVQRDGATLDLKGSVQLQPGPVAKLEVTPGRPSARGNGRDAVRLRVRALDAHGNLVPGASLQGRAQVGKMGEFEYEADAQLFTGTYSAARVEKNTVDRIEIHTGQGDTKTEVPVELLVRQPLALGVKSGYLSNGGSIETIFVAADVALRLPYLENRLEIALEVGYYGRSFDYSTLGGTDTVHTNIWALPAHLRARYRFPLADDAVQGHVGFHAGLLMVRLESTSQLGRPTSGTLRAPAFGFSAGGDVSVGLGRAGAEIGYSHAAVYEDNFVGNLAGFVALITYGVEIGSDLSFH